MFKLTISSSLPLKKLECNMYI